MSRELRVNFNAAAANLYAILRRLSDGYVWSTVTEAFAAWSDGSIADYDIALTDRGGDLYDGDMPAAVPAGDYEIGYYERAGGTPATTDLRLLTESPRHWDGAILSSGSSISLSAYALTSLDNQKRYQRITDSDDDTILTQLINAVSAEIERVCGVQFVARDRRERYNGAGQRKLKLKQWPVIDLFRLAWGWSPAVSISYSGSAIRAEVGVSDTDVRISSYASTGAATTNRFTFADYDTVSEVAAAIAAVSGWSASVAVNMPSADLNPMGGQDAKSKTVQLTYPDRGDINYTVDYASGIIGLRGALPFQSPGLCLGVLNPTGYGSAAVMPGGHQYIFVHYRAGYESVPADVEMVCNRLVAEEFYSSGSGSTRQTMSSLGPFTWKATVDQEKNIMSELGHYIDLSTCIGSP